MNYATMAHEFAIRRRNFFTNDGHCLNAARLLDLLPETAPLSQARNTSSRLAEHRVAASAQNDRLRVRIDRSDLEAPRALHVHEIAVRPLDQALELVHALLRRRFRVKEINIHWLIKDGAFTTTGNLS